MQPWVPHLCSILDNSSLSLYFLVASNQVFYTVHIAATILILQQQHLKRARRNLFKVPTKFQKSCNAGSNVNKTECNDWQISLAHILFTIKNRKDVKILTGSDEGWTGLKVSTSAQVQHFNTVRTLQCLPLCSILTSFNYSPSGS